MNSPTSLKKIYVCTNMRGGSNKPSCGVRGGKQLKERLQKACHDHKLGVDIEEIVCLGQCEKGPALRIAGGNFFFGDNSNDVLPVLNWLKDELA